MKLYTLPGSCSILSQVVLSWATQEVEIEKCSPKQLKSEDFLALNPQGSVPVLEHDGLVLRQNAAILPYLAELFPQAPVFGLGSAAQRAQVRQWFGMVNADIHSKISILFKTDRYVQDEVAQAQLRENVQAQLFELYAIIDQHLQGKTYLVDELTIVDVYVALTMHWCTNYLGMDLSQLAALQSLYQMVMNDETVKQVMAAQ